MTSQESTNPPPSTFRDEVTLEDYRATLLPLVFREFLNAHEFDTKQSIRMTVGRKTFMALEINRWEEILMMTQSQTIHVDPAVAHRIDALSQELLQKNASRENPSLNAFNAKWTSFRLKPYHDPSTLKSFLRELVNLLAPDKRFLADRRLFVILAVDGLSGLSLSEVIHNYVENLTIGNDPRRTSHRHGIAVRAMYDQIPESIPGTVASYVVAKALLELYLPVTQSEEELIKAELERIDTTLQQETATWGDLADVMIPPFIKTLQEGYQSIVKDVQSVAQQKISALKQTRKKKIASKKRKSEGQEGFPPKRKSLVKK